MQQSGRSTAIATCEKPVFRQSGNTARVRATDNLPYSCGSLPFQFKTGAILELTSLAELRRFVQSVICEREGLIHGAFRFDERLLKRQGQACGLHFTLSGPRCVQLTAIWDALHRSILFYDGVGSRFHQAALDGNGELQAELTALAVRPADCGSTNWISRSRAAMKRAQRLSA